MNIEFFIKAKRILEKNGEVSEYKFVREYLNSVQSFYSLVFEMIFYGIVEKIGGKPEELKKSIDLSEKDIDLFFKGELGEEKLDLMKGLLENFKNKISYFKNIWKKYGFGKKKFKLEPMKIKGQFVYNMKREPITKKEWKNLEDSIVDYLEASNIEEEIVIRGALLGKLIEKMEADKISKEKQRDTSWEKLTELYGDIPNTYSDAHSWFSNSEKEALKWSKQHGLKHLAIEGDLKEKMISLYKDTISEGIKNKESPQITAQKMFWVNPESEFGKVYKKSDLDIINRDWSRICKTELNYAISNGYINKLLSIKKKDEDIYMVFSGGIKYGKTGERDLSARRTSAKKYIKITCEWCEKFLGKVVKLVSEKPESGSDKISDDPYTDTVVWPDKDNVGRSQKDWWVTIPLHPNCFADPRTEIITEKGIKEIKDIKVDDLVLTHKNRYKKVTSLIRGKTIKFFVIIIESETGNIYPLKVTEDHPLYLGKNNWIKVSDLKIGTEIITAKRIKDNSFLFEKSKVTVIDDYSKINKKYFETYNFSVEEDESYIANGVVVHNCLHHWTKINPKYQEYNEKTGLVDLKDPEEIDL